MSLCSTSPVSPATGLPQSWHGPNSHAFRSSPRNFCSATIRNFRRLGNSSTSHDLLVYGRSESWQNLSKIICLVSSASSSGEVVEKCQDCTQGHTWEGSPTGTETVLADINAYVATPPSGSSNSNGAILFIHDVFGWSFVNSRLLCDFLAAETGCAVYLPDFFRGQTVISPDAVSSTDPSLWGKIQQGLKIAASIPNFLSLVQKFGPDKTQPALDSVVPAIKERHSGEGCQLGAVGYCWGGKYVLRLGAQGKLAATVACHPSLLKPVEDNLAATSAPTLFVCAERDGMFTEKLWTESEALIKQAGVPLKRVTFPGTSHGFAIRCDESDIGALKAKDKAAKQTAEWFSKYLT